jgi:hypothetical protein
MCDDCGGLKPPPLSPRAKQQLKLAKQKAESNKRNANKLRTSAAVDNALKKLPLPLRYFLSCFGIGLKKKRKQLISYHKLHKCIATKHPVDPLDGEKFSIYDSVTVSKYFLKLIDACGCLSCYKCFSEQSKKATKFIFKKKEKGIEKPSSMKDVPDDENNDSF